MDARTEDRAVKALEAIATNINTLFLELQKVKDLLREIADAQKRAHPDPAQRRGH